MGDEYNKLPMQTLSSIHLLSMAAVLLLVTAVGIYSGRKIKSAADFATGGRSAGSVLVAATIMGTLVGELPLLVQPSWRFVTASPPGGLP